MKISASVISHPGKYREKNEDNFCFHGNMLESNHIYQPIKIRKRTDEPVLMGVFDGMGGIKAGERASCIAARVACSAIAKLNRNQDIDYFLVDICKQANEYTCNEMLNVVKQRIGTTVSILCFVGEKFHLCNVGDSPIFLFRDKELRMISYEHTEKHAYIKLYGGQDISQKKKFKLTQHIGIFPEEMQIEPYVISGEIRRKDRFIISSDGLTDMVDESVIAGILNMKKSASKTVDMLLNQALVNGGKDNITITCIDIK